MCLNSYLDSTNGSVGVAWCLAPDAMLCVHEALSTGCCILFSFSMFVVRTEYERPNTRKTINFMCFFSFSALLSLFLRFLLSFSSFFFLFGGPKRIFCVPISQNIHFGIKFSCWCRRRCHRHRHGCRHVDHIPYRPSVSVLIVRLVIQLVHNAHKHPHIPSKIIMSRHRPRLVAQPICFAETHHSSSNCSAKEPDTAKSKNRII